MRKILVGALCIGLTATSFSFSSAETSNNALSALKQQFKRPTEIPFPQNSPYSLHRATLGKMLFYDPRLSGAQNMSCASCHNPSFGYEVPVPTAIGAANKPLGRHANTVINLAWTDSFFWDRRASSLEEQASGPISADVEMNAKMGVIVERLQGIPEYEKWFNRLYPGEGVSEEAILTSIATYERTIVSGQAPFDLWVEGNETAISDAAKRGFQLFNGKANCVACHSGWNFTDNAFHDIGLETDDIGRGKYEPDNKKAQFAFKTPGLRNLTYRAPFMHNGTVRDLTDVIVHYETGGIQRASLSGKMIAFELAETERADLVAFLKSLTAERTVTPIPVLPN